MSQRMIVDYSYLTPGYRLHRRRWPRVLAIALGLAMVLGGGYYGGRAALHVLRNRPAAASHALDRTQLSALTPVRPSISDTKDLSTALAAVTAPVSALLTVPYTVQAPFGNWTFHQESCEEAAVLMYHDFLDSDSRPAIPPAEADKALRALKAWQVTNWGAEKDLTIDRTGQLAQAFYGYHYQVLPATRESIQEAIAAGHPVVVPVMTHSLQNPHYGPKTVYHEVLIKGYTEAGVVSNDAGVQEGKDWFYAWSVLFGAIDAQSAQMGQGRVMLILTK